MGVFFSILEGMDEETHGEFEKELTPYRENIKNLEDRLRAQMLEAKKARKAELDAERTAAALREELAKLEDLMKKAGTKNSGVVRALSVQVEEKADTIARLEEEIASHTQKYSKLEEEFNKLKAQASKKEAV